MSMSSGAPAELSPAILELLECVKRENSMDRLVSVLSRSDTESEFEMISGAMTDGSKRRFVEESRDDRRRPEQLPVKPQVTFPKGIQSMEEWDALAGSTRQEHTSYCSWLISQKGRDDLTAPIRDLVNYLVLRLDDADSSRYPLRVGTMLSARGSHIVGCAWLLAGEGPRRAAQAPEGTESEMASKSSSLAELGRFVGTGERPSRAAKYALFSERVACEVPEESDSKTAWRTTYQDALPETSKPLRASKYTFFSERMPLEEKDSVPISSKGNWQTTYKAFQQGFDTQAYKTLPGSESGSRSLLRCAVAPWRAESCGMYKTRNESPEATPRTSGRPASTTTHGRRVATPTSRAATPRILPAASEPQPSAYCTERVLRWRLRETERQLSLTSEELQRTRFMLSHFQRHQDKRWQWEAEQVSEEVEKQQQVTEDLKFDLQKVAILALTHRDAELKSCATEMWAKWSLQGPIPRRPTKESTRVKDMGRVRAKKRWNYLSRFVAYAFAKSRRRSTINQDSTLQFLAFRVKELCDLFQPSFDEKFGVYEALMTCVRRAEVEQSVKEKLQRPKKVFERSCTGTFEELESEMISSYTDAFEEAGGPEEVSSQVPEVAELVRSYRHGRVRQDLGFEILGLRSLYQVNNRWLKKFEEEVQRLASGTSGTATIAPMKSYDRARAKVLTRYGSDVSCLTDVMRASLIYPTIAEVYSALFFILKDEPMLEDHDQPRHDFRVMEVNDRFQFCHDGYRDITLLFNMSGVICEVQMQIKGIQEVKKSGGHKAYRVQREVNELIFEAAVQNSEEDLAELVKIYKVSGQGTKDKNGRSALHYTCQHGALKATRVLLAAGSNPWLEDDHGVLPFELALKQKLFDTLELTLSVMMLKGPRFGKCLHRMAEQILPWLDCLLRTQTSFAGEKQELFQCPGRLMIAVLRYYEALPLLEPFLTQTAKLGTNFAATTIRALLTAQADQDRIGGGVTTDPVVEMRPTKLGLVCNEGLCQVAISMPCESTGWWLEQQGATHCGNKAYGARNIWCPDPKKTGSSSTFCCVRSMSRQVVEGRDYYFTMHSVAAAPVNGIGSLLLLATCSLDFAMKSGHAEMVKMLVCTQRGDGTPLAAHCFKETVHGHLKIASKLADPGYARAALLANADPRAQQAFGVGKRTALMSFAAAGELELCKELINARSEVQWIDGSCCSAVHYALCLKRTPVVDFLRAQRAITEVPLKHNSLQDVAQYLLKAVQEKEGCCGAVHRGADSLRNMQFLKKQTDSIPFKEVLRERFGPSRWTLLHYAVKVLRSADPAGQVCRALLVAKADPRLLCADGETPLHWVASLGHQQVFDALAQGEEVDVNLPVAEVLVSETQKALKRQLLRVETEHGVDAIHWLQAGLLAFKHAVLCKRLIFRDPQETSPGPSPRRLNSAKLKVEALKRSASKTFGSLSRRGSRCVTAGPKLSTSPSSTNSPRPSRTSGSQRDSVKDPTTLASYWAAEWPLTNREGFGRLQILAVDMTVKAFNGNKRALDVPEMAQRAGTSPSSAASSAGSRPSSGSRGPSKAPSAPSGSRPSSATRQMTRQVSNGSGMSRQVSGEGSRPGSATRQMSRQVSNGSSPGSKMPRQTSGGMSRQVSGEGAWAERSRHVSTEGPQSGNVFSLCKAACHDRFLALATKAARCGGRPSKKRWKKGCIAPSSRDKAKRQMPRSPGMGQSFFDQHGEIRWAWCSQGQLLTPWTPRPVFGSSCWDWSLDISQLWSTLAAFGFKLARIGPILLQVWWISSVLPWVASQWHFWPSWRAWGAIAGELLRRRIQSSSINSSRWKKCPLKAGSTNHLAARTLFAMQNLSEFADPGSVRCS
eukprot:s1847_g4.t1